MKRKLFLTALLSSCLLTGCGVKGEATVNSDGTVATTSTMYVTEEEMGAMSSMDTGDASEASTVTGESITVKGITYYPKETQTEYMTWDDYTVDTGYITKDTVALTQSDSIADKVLDFVDVKITVPFAVKYTNCKKVDAHTVRLTNKNLKTILISGKSSVKSGKDLKFVDAKTNKAIANNTYFGASKCNSVKLKPDTKDSLVLRAYVTHNGSKYDLNAYAGSSPNVGASSDGKFVATAKLASGVKKQLTYYVDTMKPSVSLNGDLLSCTDPKNDGYSSGVASITVNGKKVSNGTKIKSGDNIVVTDKAGNVAKAHVR